VINVKSQKELAPFVLHVPCRKHFHIFNISKVSFEEEVMVEKKSHFGSNFFEFLKDLKANNNRQWFNANKEQYIDEVRTPLQQFVLDFGPHLKKISHHFIADPRLIGGSIFRVYRDIRFSKDKTPYKTHAAAQFRHTEGKSAHAPCFYLHLSPSEVLAGFGIWQPDSPSLLNIRNTIVSKPGEWKKVVKGKNFKLKCIMGGVSLKRPPKGFDPDHPFIEDLKRKDFFSQINFTPQDASSSSFIDEYIKACKTAVPFMKFLTKALDLEF
jgi:uncharacterized protein (TIGR02453 family)